MALTKTQLKTLRESAVPETGNRLQTAVDLLGVTLVTIHEATELPYSYISDTVRGRYQTITVDNARKFADFFGCSIEDLFPAREAVAS